MNQNKSFQERRQHPRVDGNIPVKIKSEEFDIVTETKNLSRTGAYCRVNKFIEPMTRLNLCLLLPFKKKNKITTKKITCRGVIVRTEAVAGQDYFDIAIYFNEINKKDADAISEYINVALTSQTFSSEN